MRREGKVAAGGGEPVLDERSIEVLRTIVVHHIQTGEPVPSGVVSRGSRLGLSPASIRGIMSELEELGLLVQPHASAGRVPTDRAFRLYVDQLMGRPRLAPGQAQSIESALIRTRGELDDLLGEASRQLSQVSHQVGLVLAPDVQRLVVARLEFVRLDDRRVVAILVSRSGVVHHRILEPDEPLEPRELERIGRYLTVEFGGRTLPEIRDMLKSRLHEERATYDRMMRLGLELGRQAAAIEETQAELFVEGASNLLILPEFADLDLLRAMFRTLEEKRRLVDLLTQVLEGDGVQVVIGEENPVSDLSRCSLVASTYGTGERTVGSLAIVGPTRMPYGRLVALVEYLSGLLTRLLSSPGN